MPRRTDLAMEAREIYAQTGELTKLRGVRARDAEIQGFQVTQVDILDDEGAGALGKPCGRYITLSLDPLFKREPDAFSRACRAIAECIRPLLPGGERTVLVAGIGNANITPDAIGPLTMNHICVTRHMVERVPEYFDGFRPVACVVPGVLGSTGIESRELVRGAAEHVKPACIVVVDALASRSLSRLCSTIQITDAGIVPGSGIGNSRAGFSKETLGVPVIAVGAPTVVDAVTLALDLLEEAGLEGVENEIQLRAPGSGSMIVTPRDIDTNVADMAKVIGYGLNLAFHDDMEISDIDMFLS